MSWYKCTYNKMEGYYGCHHSFQCWLSQEWYEFNVTESYGQAYLVSSKNYKHLKFDGEICSEVRYIVIKCNDLETVDILRLPLSVTHDDFARNSLTYIKNLQRPLELHNMSFIDLRSNWFRSFILKNLVPATVDYLGLSGNVITGIYIKTLLYRMSREIT